MNEGKNVNYGDVSPSTENNNEEVLTKAVYNEDDTRDEPMDTEIAESKSSLREIHITPISSGYLVKVGCQTIAIETTETLVKTLSDYLLNPRRFEVKWYSKEVRNRLENL